MNSNKASPEVNTVRWWIMRIANPDIREWYLNHKKYEDKLETHADSLQYALGWLVGREYKEAGRPNYYSNWRDIKLLDQPYQEPYIWDGDVLPDEYWIENSQWPKEATTEWQQLAQKAGKLPMRGCNKWYKISRNSHVNCWDREPNDGCPVVPYHLWKAILNGETAKEPVQVANTPQQESYKVGDEVVCIDITTDYDDGNGAASWRKGTLNIGEVYTVESVSTQGIRLAGKSYAHAPQAFRRATQADKQKTQGNDSKYGFSIGDWIMYDNGHTDGPYQIASWVTQGALDTKGQFRAIEYGYRKCRPDEIPQQKGKVKLSFRTEDGYELYEGDTPIWVYRKEGIWSSSGRWLEVCEDHKKDLNRKLFHTEAAAEKFIQQQSTPQVDSSEIDVGDTIEVTDGRLSAKYYNGQQFTVVELASGGVICQVPGERKMFYTEEITKVKSNKANNQSITNKPKTKNNGKQDSSSSEHITGRVIISRNPEATKVIRARRSSGTPGYCGGELYTNMRGYQRNGKVIKVSQEARR